jgi:hypothetical protein
MGPAAHLDDRVVPEELVIAAVGVGMNVPIEVLKKIKWTPLAAIKGDPPPFDSGR